MPALPNRDVVPVGTAEENKLPVWVALPKATETMCHPIMHKSVFSFKIVLLKH